jgi:hypothetical protein
MCCVKVQALVHVYRGLYMVAECDLMHCMLLALRLLSFSSDVVLRRDGVRCVG